MPGHSSFSASLQQFISSLITGRALPSTSCVGLCLLPTQVALNLISGRRPGDRTFHPVMPWVLNFSALPAELSKAVVSSGLTDTVVWSGFTETVTESAASSDVAETGGGECVGLAVCECGGGGRRNNGLGNHSFCRC